MYLAYPSLEYEINTQVRIHRELKNYTQEEFAFLIGRNLVDVQNYEDLTLPDGYNLNHLNFYARILGCVAADLVFTESILEDKIKLIAIKKEFKTKTVFRGERILDNGERIHLPTYEVPKIDKPVNAEEFERMLSILDNLLLDGYFKEGKTGFQIYEHCVTLWGTEFRVQLLINGLATLSGRRKGRKLMPMRKVPKTAETRVVYKE